MVKYSTQDLDHVFHALANATRRDIILQVAQQEMTVNDIANHYDMSLPAVSKHIKVLMKAGLVIQKREGRVRHCRLDYEPLEAASDVIQKYRQFWESQLDALEAYLEETEPKQ